MGSSWTDNPATSATHIRTSHINELRYVVDINHSAAGLGFYTWTNYPVTISTHIRAIHFTELRSAIQDLWNHQGMGALLGWSYGSAPSGMSGRRISARDINDLRTWVDQYEAQTGQTFDPPGQFGVDSTDTLDTFTWSSFRSWSGYYPSFAGRYFDVSYTWKGGEGRSAKAATGGVLAYIAPLQSSHSDNQSKQGSAGFSQGQSDADTTCLTILANINSGELAISVPQYATYVQSCIAAGHTVPLIIWQYAERTSCLAAPCSRSSSIFGSQNVDLDRSFASPDLSNMLVIKSS